MKTITGGASLRGKIQVPPSKSHSLRALLLAALADGESTIDNLLPSPDIEAMCRGIRQLGAPLTLNGRRATVQGVGGRPQPAGFVDAGNSGQVLRFVGAVAALADGETVISGDHSLRTRRPVAPLVSGIRQLGGSARSVTGSGAPIAVQGPLRAGEAEIDGTDSQPVSALLVAMSLLDGKSVLRVRNPGETPWLEVTLHWLQRLGVSISHQDYTRFDVIGGKLDPFAFTIPGDYSSALYPVAAGLLTDSDIEVTGLDETDVQGDKAAVEVLKGMREQPCEVDVNPFIDALPLLAVMGCYSKGKTVLRGGSIARKKECDRIASIACELKKMGAHVNELEDGLIIEESQLRGARVSTYRDHRIAMSLAVAALRAEGETHIEDSEVVAKSYPTFWEDLRSLGCLIG